MHMVGEQITNLVGPTLDGYVFPLFVKPKHIRKCQGPRKTIILDSGATKSLKQNQGQYEATSDFAFLSEP